MTVHIKNLRVRPRKAQEIKLCNAELTTMLGCWAATGDFHSQQKCMQAAEALFHCMRTTPVVKKPHKPAINYHLARLGKKIQ